MENRISCQTCGELFEPRTSGGRPQVRCSERCRRKVANANYIKVRAPVRSTACAECGTPIVQADSGRPRRYCSDACKQRVGNRAQNRRRLPAPKAPDRNCEHCGKPFEPRRRDQVLCSMSCAQAAYRLRKRTSAPARQGVAFDLVCVECGLPFVARKNNAKWCSPICRIRTCRRDESRRRTPGSGASLYADREIFERDGWVCQICRVPVDRTVDRRHPDGATIDHTIPLSRGGLDVADNVVTAHWRCNRKKGNRVGP